MSLANYLLNNGQFAFPSQISSNETVDGSLVIENAGRVITHSIDASGNYNVVSNTGATLLSFTSSDALGTCTVQTALSSGGGGGGGGGLGGGEISLSSLLSSSGNAGGNSITNLSSVSCSSANIGLYDSNPLISISSGSNVITSNTSAQLQGFYNVPSVMSGTFSIGSNSFYSYNVVSGEVLNITGTIRTRSSFCRVQIFAFAVVERFVGTVVNLSNFTYDGMLASGESVAVETSGSTLSIVYTSSLSGNPYTFLYLVQ